MATGLVGTVSLAGCISNQPSSSASKDSDTVIVEVGPNNEFVFIPGTSEPLRIPTGTTVQFVWKSDTHNLHVDAQPKGANWTGHEPIENTGFEYEYVFKVKGEYHYWCEPHRSLGMVADITVE